MKEFARRQMLNRLSDTIERVAHIRAEEERALIDATATLADALDADLRVDLRGFDREERAAELIALAEAMPDEEPVAEWYAEHRLPDPDLVAYVGIGEDGAAEQIGAWADRYREESEYPEHTDRDLADAHVRRAFDAPGIEWWEREVATVEKSDIVRTAVAGYAEAIELELRRLAEQVDGT